MTTQTRIFATSVPIIVAVIGALSTDNPVSRWVFGRTPQPAVPPIQGYVMISDVMPQHRLGLKGVQVVETDAQGFATGPAETGDGGTFLLPLKPGVQSGESVFIQLSLQGYQTFTTHVTTGDGVLYPFYIWPDSPGVARSSSRAGLVEAAYAPTDNRSETFPIPNLGSVRCNGHEPCSPDRKWKANIVTSPALDAGAGNVFLSGHAECIAGPCAWTHIEDANGSPRTGQRTMTITVRNWSDTATYRLSGVAGRQR